jgi:hypothetical protein
MELVGQMKILYRLALLGLLLGLLPSTSFATCSVTSITVKDGAGSSQTFCIGGAGGALLNQGQIVDSTGANILGVNASGQLTISNSGFTANAGTNLNTSALALETGGNLATLAGGVTSSVYQHNLKQVNGTTVLVNTGAVGTGAQRVAVGTDTATIAGSAPGTAGTASANVVTVQGVASMTPVQVSQATAANLNATVVGTGTFAVQSQANIGNSNVQMHICGSYAKVHITTATDTQLVAVSGSQTIYICDIEFSAAAAQNFYLEKSTSGSCGTVTQIGILWTLAANEIKTAANAYYRGFNTGASASLCVDTSAAAGLDVGVYYDQY